MQPVYAYNVIVIEDDRIAENCLFSNLSDAQTFFLDLIADAKGEGDKTAELTDIERSRFLVAENYYNKQTDTRIFLSELEWFVEKE